MINKVNCLEYNQDQNIYNHKILSILHLYLNYNHRKKYIQNGYNLYLNLKRIFNQTNNYKIYKKLIRWFKIKLKIQQNKLKKFNKIFKKLNKKYKNIINFNNNKNKKIIKT